MGAAQPSVHDYKRNPTTKQTLPLWPADSVLQKDFQSINPRSTLFGSFTLVDSEDQPRSKIISKRSKRSKRSSPVDDLWVNIVSPSASLFQNIWRKYSRVESKTKQYKVPQRRDIWINESIHQPRLNSLQRGQEPLLGCICNPCSTETKNSKIVNGKWISNYGLSRNNLVKEVHLLKRSLSPLSTGPWILKSASIKLWEDGVQRCSAFFSNALFHIFCPEETSFLRLQKRC